MSSMHEQGGGRQWTRKSSQKVALCIILVGSLRETNLAQENKGVAARLGKGWQGGLDVTEVFVVLTRLAMIYKSTRKPIKPHVRVCM